MATFSESGETEDLSTLSAENTIESEQSEPIDTVADTTDTQIVVESESSPPPPMEEPKPIEDEDLTVGFKRPEMNSESFPKPVNPYDRHVFLAFDSALSWPKHVENVEAAPLSGAFNKALSSRKADIGKKIKFTVIEGAGLSDGDVLIFPEMIKYKNLTSEDVEGFVDDVLVKETTSQALGEPEQLSGYYVFVCAHAELDKRCGVCGPVLIEKLKEEIAEKGLGEQVFVSACSHVGGHKYAGNVIIYGAKPDQKVTDYWYGYVTPEDVPLLLDDHIGKGEIIERRWRGEVCNYEEKKDRETELEPQQSSPPFLDNYIISDEEPSIQGGQGLVLFGTEKNTKREVAIKRIHSPDGEFSKYLLREMGLLKEIDHPCIISLISIKYEDPYLYLVTPAMGYNLKGHQSAFPSKYPLLIPNLMKNLLEGLEMLHDHGVMHRDIKPENLLIAEGCTLKICDFGHARAQLNPELTPDLVTVDYRAPEVLLGDPDYSFGIDVWAAGCVFAEMSVSKQRSDDDIPFADFSEDEVEEEQYEVEAEEEQYEVEGEEGASPGEEVEYESLFGFGVDANKPMDVLLNIFRLLGTPTEATWPGVTSLPKWDATFEMHYGEDMDERFSALGTHGVDLLKKMLCLNPAERVTASVALLHPYFHQN